MIRFYFEKNLYFWSNWKSPNCMIFIWAKIHLQQKNPWIEQNCTSIYYLIATRYYLQHLRFQFNSSLLIPLLGLTFVGTEEAAAPAVMMKKTAITWLEAGKIQRKKGQMCGSSSITLLLPAAMSSILSDHHTSCKWCQSAAHSITPLLRWKVQISSFTTSSEPPQASYHFYASLTPLSEVQ